jgi:hypothetical protein
MSDNFEPLYVTKNPIYGISSLAFSKRPNSLIEGFLPSKGIVIIAAAPFTGKTFLGLEITRAISTRTPFLGKYKTTPRKAKVLIIEEDSADWDFRVQYEKITGNKLNEETVIERLSLNGEDTDNVAYSIQQIQWLSDERFVRELAYWANQHSSFIGYHTIIDEEIGEPDSVPQYEYGFDVIILDSLTALHNFDENQNREMHRVVENIRLLSHLTGSCVVILHHINKGGGENYDPRNGLTLDRLRGASSIVAAADVVIGLYKKARFNEEIHLQMLKNRAFPEMRDISYYFHTSEDGENVSLNIVSSTAGTTSSRVKIVSNFLQENRDGWVETSSLVQMLQAKEKLEGIESTEKTYQDVIYRVLTQLGMEELIERKRGNVKWKIQTDFPEGGLVGEKE